MNKDVEQFEIDEAKYTVESLKVIYKDSKEYLGDINTSIREVVNKSYVAIAVYGSIGAKVIFDVNAGIYSQYIGIVLIILSILPILVVFWNTAPKAIAMNGATPEQLSNDYFEYYKDSQQERVYYARLIELLSGQIIMNSPILDRVSFLLKWSIYLELFFLLILIFSRFIA